MENGRMLKHQLGYLKLLRIVGQFCDKEKLDEISVLEFEKGILLQGIKVDSTSQGYIRRMATYTWSYEDLAAMSEPSTDENG
ncbi:MAG: hypothetical protein JXA37_14080 [Chloroflexia bacterium]|nr:hypothetical protein [Chloroflexia bacterium]